MSGVRHPRDAHLGDCWVVEYTDGKASRMVWVGPTFGPPRPPRPGKCHRHDHLQFGCALCHQYVYGWPR